MLNDYGKSLFRPWLSAQNVCLSLALVFICGLFIRIYDLKSSDIASWVQAIGSILAIVGAFAVGGNQARAQQELVAEQEHRQERARAADRKKRAKSYLSVIQHAASQCQYVTDIAEGRPLEVFKGQWEAHYKELCLVSISSLKLLPAHELGTHDLVLAYINVLAGFSNFISEADRVVVEDKKFHAPGTDKPYAGLVMHNGVVHAGLELYTEALNKADETLVS
ncbi:hypothetical protein [Pseudomonas sp. UBA5568]|uniref:hypothetical protein n=1 Tax=Pseudomonas sp. UBA5568 TaxID=1947319 RepID=UPI00259151E1|nr:hypothetical protein [Pseudomonas sp. UBA5568]